MTLFPLSQEPESPFSRDTPCRLRARGTRLRPSGDRTLPKQWNAPPSREGLRKRTAMATMPFPHGGRPSMIRCLTSLVERAVSGNLDLKSARSRVREARARRGVSEARLFPAVDADGLRHQEPFK